MIHNWIRESGRRSRCRDCDLLAKTKSSPIDRGPYTEWTWQDNARDSRSHVLPDCPPRHA